MNRKPASTPGVLFVANKTQKGCGDLRPDFRLPQFRAIDDRRDVQRFHKRLPRDRHAVTLLKEQTGVQREGNLTVWFCPLHRPPHKREI